MPKSPSYKQGALLNKSPTIAHTLKVQKKPGIPFRLEIAAALAGLLLG
jgi:hypothetical protein